MWETGVIIFFKGVEKGDSVCGLLQLDVISAAGSHDI